MFGSWLQFLCNATQHVGLQDEVPDYRLCCRTFYINPVLQFLYWHMNYHTEHHMYAAVPCYRLGRLHRLIKHEMPYCTSGLWETWKQIIRDHGPPGSGTRLPVCRRTSRGRAHFPETCMKITAIRLYVLEDPDQPQYYHLLKQVPGLRRTQYTHGSKSHPKGGNLRQPLHPRRDRRRHRRHVHDHDGPASRWRS